MSYSFGNRTVKDGLVFYLDAENRLSYTPNNTEWKSIAKSASVGYFNLSGPPVFTNNLYELNKKAIDFRGSNQAIIGHIGIDNLLDVNKTGTITVQIYFAIENLEEEKYIFASGWKGDVGLHPQYAVGITAVSNDPNSTWIILEHGEAYNQIDTRGIIGLKRFCCITISFGASTKVYINDTYFGEHNTTPLVPDIQGNYWTVGYNAVRDLNFDGGVNAIRVYNRELTAAEVINSYNFFTQRS